MCVSIYGVRLKLRWMESKSLGVNVNFLGWWIFQIGLSVARQMFDLYCIFLFWLLFGMYNCILLFFYMSPGDKNRAPHNSIEGLFLPTFIFVFLHKRIVTCVLGYYLTIRNLCPIQCSHNENDGMNAQWVLSPLSLSFSLAFSSPLSTAIAVPTLLQIPLQPFNSINSIMGS